MGLRYKAGLGLIGLFVFIWVSSAEVTQVWDCSYNSLLIIEKGFFFFF